jgi:hypothetical protein
MGDLFTAVFGAVAGPMFLFLGLGVLLFTLHTVHVDIVPVLSFIVATSPLWVPFTLFHLLFERWQDYGGLKFAANNGRVTLRIKPPQDVFKSPEAMEGVLAQIFTSNSCDNLVQAYIDGKRPQAISLELANVGGEVRFYMNVPKKKVKNILEAQLYAQYPGIEVYEEKIDYTAEVRNDLDKHDFMAFHFTKKEADYLPIKTYIDYGHDKMPKEEEKFEPMAPMIEHVGKCKPHERVWIQFICTPHIKKNFKNGHWVEKGTWEKGAKTYIAKMLGRNEKGLGPAELEAQPRLTNGERDTIAAIERNIGKYAYEVAIRAMYITLDKNKFDGDMIGPILRSVSQWDMIGRNAVGIRWRTDFDWPWISDPSGSKKKYYKKRELDYYKARYYTEGDVKNFVDSPKVMSVEEIASMYHIPGKTIITPNVARVESIRRNAPPNLPIGAPPF